MLKSIPAEFFVIRQQNFTRTLLRLRCVPMTEREQRAHSEAQVSLRQRLVPVTNNDNPLSLRPQTRWSAALSLHRGEGSNVIYSQKTVVNVKS